MDQLEIVKLSYELYRDQNTRRHQFLTKASFSLTAVAIVSGGALTFGRLDLLQNMFLRVDTFLYYLSCMVCWICILGTVIFMIRVLWPSSYEVIDPFQEFLEWRDGYAAELAQAGYDQQEAMAIAGEAMLNNMARSFSKAERFNRNANLVRQQALNRSFYFLTLSIFALFWLVVFSKIMKLQGI